MNESGRVYEVLKDGGVALVPTCAGYGLLALRTQAVERIYALKGRPANKPCITVATWPIFDEVVAAVDAPIRAWLAETVRWTPLAVVGWIRPHARLLAPMEPFVRAQCTSAGTIATFHAAGELVTGVAEHAFADGTLIVGSSANRSGTGNCYTVAEVPDEMRRGVDLVIDVGPVARLGAERLATTLLDLTQDRFLREGIRFAEIERSWRAFRQGGQPSAAVGGL